MAKTKNKSHSRTQSSTTKDVLHSTTATTVKSTSSKKKKNIMSDKSVEELLSEATALLEQSQPELALPLAEEALRRLESSDASVDIDDLVQKAAEGHVTLPTALTISADIRLALGDVDRAREAFLKAVEIDPDGDLVSAEPYLWLAQLGEQGGKESVFYFEKAVDVLRSEIEVLGSVEGVETEQTQDALDQKRKCLADALCGITEVYMTDLSWEDNAEAMCERLVTEAVAVCPERLSASVLQTLASVRISQERFDDAKQALRRSLELWKELPDEIEDVARPDFATRVSLARLLMEVEVEVDAMAVLERLVVEDDESVECWYLGGWCQVLISQKMQDGQDKIKSVEKARLWLETCLKLYRKVSYEDDRLRDHAKELVEQLNKSAGIEGAMEEDQDDDAWEDEDEEASDIDEDEEVDLVTNGLGEHQDGDVEMT